jgi:LuxR family maltose regulon positive regulatory protein
LRCGQPIATSLDEADSDPARFMLYFIAALQTIAPDIGAGVLGVLQASQPQKPLPESILTTLLNEISAIPNNFILVLDDYHLIDSKPLALSQLSTQASTTANAPGHHHT